MSFIVKGSNSEERDFVLAPIGVHQAICNLVVDIGRQETTWLGVVKIKPQCIIRWELPTERIDYVDRKTGQTVSGPLLVRKIYNVTMDRRSTLRKDLEGWRGRVFTETELQGGIDLFRLAGQCCQVNIVHDKSKDGTRTYANVDSIVGWPKGVQKPKMPENGILLYSPDRPEHLPDLPDWIKAKIDRRIKDDEEPKEGPQSDDEGGSGAGGNDDLDDDIPF